MVKILSWTGRVLFDSEKPTVKEAVQDAVLQGADLRDAVLRGAVLQGAVLRGADQTLEPYFQLCAKDILYVFQHTASEVPELRKKLIAGEVNGTQYEGECCCLIGSLSKAKGQETDQYCSHIPFYTKGLENYGEQWFWNIREGDTPENSYFCKKAVELCDLFLSQKKAA